MPVVFLTPFRRSPYWMLSLDDGLFNLGDPTAATSGPQITQPGTTYQNPMAYHDGELYIVADAVGSFRNFLRISDDGSTINTQVQMDLTNFSNIAVEYIDSSGNFFFANRGVTGSNKGLIEKRNASGASVSFTQRVTPVGTMASVVIDPSNGDQYLTYTTGSPFYTNIDKFNSTGTLQQEVRLTATGSLRIFDGAVDSSGNFYGCGYVYDVNAFGQEDPLIVKFNSSGTLLWQATLGLPPNARDNARYIALDTAENNVFVCIASTDAADVRVAKFTSGGSLSWHRELVGAGVVSGLAVDSSDNVYISSYNAGTDNSFIIKYDSLGNLLWQRRLSTDADEIQLRGLILDPSETAFYVAGFVRAYAAQSKGENDDLDGFVAKLPVDGSLMDTYAVDNATQTYNITYADPSLTEQAGTPGTASTSSTLATSTPSLPTTDVATVGTPGAAAGNTLRKTTL